jgi:hypothetical protein
MVIQSKSRSLAGRIPCWSALPAICIAMALGIALPGESFAQVSVVRSGSFELGAFAGVTYGVDQVRALGGGNVTYAVNKWLLPYVEYSYFPGIPRTLNQSVPGLSNVTATSTFPVPLSDFHGGVHIRIPIRESPIVPYLVFGVGGLTHFQHDRTLTYTGADGLPHSIPVTDSGGTDFAVNFGGGVRYYLNQRFGFRLEAKGYRPSDSSITPVFGKVEIGFFYQLR